MFSEHSQLEVFLCSYLGDNPRADTFLVGTGEDLSEGEGEVLGVREGVRGEGVLFLEDGPDPDTVRRVVGRLGPGEEAGVGWRLDLEAAGDLDLVLGDPGTERTGLGEVGRDTERGEAGTERWGEQQSSSRSSEASSVINKSQTHGPGPSLTRVIDYLNTNESLLATFEQPFVIVPSLAGRELFSAIHYEAESREMLAGAGLGPGVLRH